MNKNYNFEMKYTMKKLTRSQIRNQPIHTYEQNCSKIGKPTGEKKLWNGFEDPKISKIKVYLATKAWFEFQINCSRSLFVICELFEKPFYH
jgi:hypothetical protein